MASSKSTGSLRQITTFEALVGYLRDELGWPIEAEDLEDAIFDWEPEELGIAPERLPSLQSLRQLRPLTATQPWGIFFIEFDGPRLPVTALRRVLERLVTKKRASAGPNRRTWHLEDLLFIVRTQSDVSIEVHLVSFREREMSPAEIRSLAWRPHQSPERYLRRLDEELLPHLAWPEDPNAGEAWRDEWRAAFKLRHGEAITSASRLAMRMADVASDMRAMISGAIDDERGHGPFTDLLGDVRERLVADVDQDRFSDMCAQTMVYGVLTSRVTDPQGFGASPSLSTIPLSNPFLTAFFDRVQDEVIDLERIGSGFETLIDDLRATNVEAILDQFGSTAKGGDPVIHFYEEFLQQYDRKLRADAGAFYTPQPVVAFMVRAADQLLREQFGLELGAADVTSWAEVATQAGFDVPAGVDPESPFLSIIDPATGTGTFLVEWLKQARRSFTDSRPHEEWPGHLQDHLLPTIHAFELMLGPFAIAHLKVALELHGEAVHDAAASILLTDTLDHAPSQQSLETMRDALAVEGELARDLKDQNRFTVVIGNPPYDREQRATGATGKRKGGIVRYGVPGVKPLLDDVIDPMTSAGLGVHVKNLYNDYVYFWRWATWQATQHPEGPGMVAFITAASYLDGTSMGGLRHHLRDRFDELWIIDLGGEGRGARVEENVFDIRTPVAIAFGVRTGSNPQGGGCTVRYRAVTGSRQEKFEALARLELEDAEFVEVEGSGLDRFTPRGDAAYYDWPEINDLFPWIHSGCQVKRTWPIGPSEAVLQKRWKSIVSAPRSDRPALMKETRDRRADQRPRPLLGKGASALPSIEALGASSQPEKVVRYGYRSFDRQWFIADNRIADFPRPQLWACSSNRQIYLTTLTSTRLGNGPVVTATPYVPDLDHFRGSYGAKNVIPLYRDGQGRKPNLTDGLCHVLTEILGIEVGPLEVIAYVYALTGTGAFARFFEDEIAEGAGPVRVPITAEASLFQEAVELGRQLLWLHTWGERYQPVGRDFPVGTATLTRPLGNYPNDFTYIEADHRLLVGDGVVEPVSKEVWEFEVSGLRVVRSWLGYRMADGKGRKSSPLDEIRPSRWEFDDELLRLIAILQSTIDLTPRASVLLAGVLGGELIDAADLPTPDASERKPPSA